MFLPLMAGAIHAQGLEVSGNGGFGVAERDGYGLPGVPSAGVSIGWPSNTSGKIQFDYGFSHIERKSVGAGPGLYNRHFFTGSYVRQLRAGRVHPFVQGGAGVQYETNNLNSQVQRDFDSNAFRTVFAGVVGAGVTIPVGRGFFLRPQFRTYIAPGRDRTVNVTALFLLGAGWRF